MIISLAYIFLLGMTLSWCFKKIKFPNLLAYIITGIILGPYVLNAIDSSILNISAELRQIALIIILIRAGITLNIADLKKVGRPAILMCFVPACFEMIGMCLLAPKFFGVSLLEAAIIGAVIAAVSPAVIVPKMIKLIEEGYGKNNSIPQLILAGASVDDVFVIVMFTAFTGLATGGSINIFDFLSIPISIILGIVLGLVAGFVLIKLFKKVHIRDTVKVVILLSISFIFVTIENWLKGIIPISGLIAVMSMGIMINKKYEILAKRITGKFAKLWVVAEIMLFVLVGASVNINYALNAGINAIILILLVLVFRMIGVFVCLLKTKLSMKERVFCMIAYCPKATVQAAIGGVPLAMGLECGEIVLTLAVIAILITATLGAFGIDLTYQKFLEK